MALGGIVVLTVLTSRRVGRLSNGGEEGERPGRLARREQFAAYMFLLPWLFGLICFLIVPIVVSIILSATDYSIVLPSQWVGLQNYQTMLHDPIFWQSLTITLKYVLFSVPVYLVAGLGLSLLLNMKRRGVNLFRTIIFLPYVISGVAVAVLWASLLNPDFGGVNWFLRHVGISDPPRWLQSPTWALPSIVLIGLWAVGGGAIIYLSGLQNIPEQLYEAAAVDGANVWQRFRYVTFPMLTPTLLFVLLTSLVQAFQVFDVVFVLSGGPTGTLGSQFNFYLFNMWTQGFGNGRLGYASALAWVLVLLSGLVIVLVFKLASRWVYYEYEGR
jgi:multiple sugar transport system permease protein